jgi:hypothetical protein
VFLLELTWRTTQDQSQIGQRYYLISGGKGVFRNVNDIFLYERNSLIKHRVWIDTEHSFEKVYSYEFLTNNYGLVQNFYITPNKDSILILGDSFTEGTGAPPWFNGFARKFPDQGLQLVNGGILGTGFLHWVGLHEYLINEGFRFSKVIIIFISDDLTRKRWTFPDEILKCLENWQICKGWENILAIPPRGKEFQFLENIRNYKLQSVYYVKFNLKESLKKMLPGATDVYRRILRLLSRKSSEKVIHEFIELYGKNLIFVHIPMK